MAKAYVHTVCRFGNNHDPFHLSCHRVSYGQ
jgi:hypothetical protein